VAGSQQQPSPALLPSLSTDYLHPSSDRGIIKPSPAAAWKADEFVPLERLFTGMQRSIAVHNLEETDRLGRRLGERLFPGAVVALVGQLGAGKTNLVRAVAVGLGIANPDVVSSPTFVLIQEYDARLPIYHFDAYRLNAEAEFAELGVHEYFAGAGVCLVEWADKVAGVLPADRLEIRMAITGPESRRIEIEARGERYVELLEGLKLKDLDGER
jgi:tRNA threonylcarbamoyladenosine biosynthesis protein TsaE